MGIKAGAFTRNRKPPALVGTVFGTNAGAAARKQKARAADAVGAETGASGLQIAASLCTPLTAQVLGTRSKHRH